LTDTTPMTFHTTDRQGPRSQTLTHIDTHDMFDCFTKHVAVHRLEPLFKNAILQGTVARHILGEVESLMTVLTKAKCLPSLSVKESVTV